MATTNIANAHPAAVENAPPSAQYARPPPVSLVALRGTPTFFRASILLFLFIHLHVHTHPSRTPIHHLHILIQELIAGGVTGAVAKTAVAPLERCKILFQTGKLHSAGVTLTLRDIFRTEGARGLFRGNGASVLRIIPYSSVHWGLYEHYRRVVVDLVYGKRDHHHGVDPIVDLVSGSAAGATAVLVTYPLDLVRTRLAYMTESNSSSTPPASTTTTATTTTATKTKTSSIKLKPTNVQTTRMTISGIITATVRQEGVRGLYHGMSASMYGILPYAGLKFFVYQHMKQGYLAVKGEEGLVMHDNAASSHHHHHSHSSSSPRARLPIPAMLLFGGMAGLIAQTATYPLDVVRRRMQVEGLKHKELMMIAITSKSCSLDAMSRPLPTSTPAALVAIAKRQGWRALYRGLSINYMKVIPSTAIGFTMYDYLKSALDLPTHL